MVRHFPVLQVPVTRGDKIEAAQRKSTEAKKMQRCEDTDYPARLGYFHLYSLERRRLTADLILT